MRQLRTSMVVAGLLVIIGGVLHFGAGDVLAAVAAVGWGITALVALEIVMTAARALAWRELGLGSDAVGVADWLAARWLRQSVSQLLPVAQVGGDVVGTQALHRRGLAVDVAAAATVVDVTLSATAQMLVTVCGLVAFGVLLGGQEWVMPMAIATVVLSVLIGIFLWLQQRGLFSRLANRLEKHSKGLLSLVGGAERLDAAIKTVYAARGRLAKNLCLHAFIQFAGTVEVLLICALIGAPIGVMEAFLLQSLSRAARAVAFFVPGGLGVQEVTIVWLITTLGLDPVTGVALALLKRARELLVGVPALAAWPWLAGGPRPA